MAWSAGGQRVFAPVDDGSAVFDGKVWARGCCKGGSVGVENAEPSGKRTRRQAISQVDGRALLGERLLLRFNAMNLSSPFPLLMLKLYILASPNWLKQVSFRA